MKHTIYEWMGNYTIKDVAPERLFAYRMNVIITIAGSAMWGIVLGILVS